MRACVCVWKKNGLPRNLAFSKFTCVLLLLLLVVVVVVVVVVAAAAAAAAAAFGGVVINSFLFKLLSFFMCLDLVSER